MTQDEIIEAAIQGHASTRDAIRWAMNQEREACALIADSYVAEEFFPMKDTANSIKQAIQARGEA